MSANLDRRADGTAAMFSVILTPWHNEGQILAAAPRTAKEAAKEAGLDWQIELRPALMALENGDSVEVPGAQVICRADREKPFAVVGSIYQPLQNLAMLETLQPLIDLGLASWETAGSLCDGRKVWGMVRYNLDSKIIRQVYGDELVPFGFVTNSHDGRSMVSLAESVVRIVCSNTHLAAMHSAQNLQRVRHDGAVEVNVVEAARALYNNVLERHEELARQFLLLKATRLDDKLFRQLVLDTALPLPSIADDASDLSKSLLKSRTEKAEAKREIVVKLFTQGLGHEGDRSAWEAYNALTEATDHAERGVFAVKGSRAQALMDGGLATVKQAVYAKLLGFAQDQQSVVTLAV